MSDDKILRHALNDALDNGTMTAEDLFEATNLVTLMQSIVNHCTPMDCALPKYTLAMSIQGNKDDWCGFFLPIENKTDLSTLENRKLNSDEAIFTRVGSMFVDYGLSIEEHHDGLLLLVKRHQLQILNQLSEDLDDAVKKKGYPELDITYQPQ